MILIDAGPMVALISASDRHHEICRATLATLNEKLLTVWPAVTEAMYLLRSSWPAQSALWEMIERGAINVAPLDETDAHRMRRLMEKYRDLPMDLADAALVRLAERGSFRRIFTLDRRDFSLYRPTGIGRFIILPAAR
ncbi:MAG TPA: PIN domain-containing protein [Thermoanaerobaculia bacterium]|nr:PIN domain-containing protein [Thermoanaerobaculia bacterium]